MVIAMKKVIVTLVTAAAVAMVYAAVDVSGTWEIEATFDDVSLAGGGFDCVIKQSSETLSGSCSDGSASLAGEIDGQKIVWRVSGADNPPVVTTFSGTLNESGKSIEGRFTAGSRGGSFRADRQ